MSLTYHSINARHEGVTAAVVSGTLVSVFTRLVLIRRQDEVPVLKHPSVDVPRVGVFVRPHVALWALETLVPGRCVDATVLETRPVNSTLHIHT